MVSKSQQHHQQQQLQQTATTGEYLTMILLLNYYVFPQLFSMMNFDVVVIHLGSHTDTHTYTRAKAICSWILENDWYIGSMLGNVTTISKFTSNRPIVEFPKWGIRIEVIVELNISFDYIIFWEIILCIWKCALILRMGSIYLGR